jgi:hypothetical protein
MDCVNHPGTNAEAYCQNCGKPMCATCVRRGPSGEVMCDPCWTTWQNARAPYPAPGAPIGMGRCPSPVLAALLGFIPGVGAMFNGQFAKGFLHVIIFAVLVSMSHIFDAFGIVVAAWVFYQVFDAFQTAKAKCEGQPLPDPLGMNELLSWFGHEFRQSQGMPPAARPSGYTPPPPPAGPAQGQTANPYQSGYQPPPFYGAPPAAGFAPGYPPPPPAAESSTPVPPLPPVPPVYWRRREPVAAIILIALGVLFLLGQFSFHALHYAWPILLIGLGIWLVIRRMNEARYVAPPPPTPDTQPSATPADEQRSSNEDSQGGMQ